MVFNTDGSIVGYKYFSFGKDSKEEKTLTLSLNLIPEGIDGTITVMADRPWASQGGRCVGTLNITADMPKKATDLTIDMKPLTGKHALYLVFTSPTKGKSICTLNSLLFMH